MDGFVLEEKSSFKKMGLPLSSKLDWATDIVCIYKTASKKIRIKFLSPEVAVYTTQTMQTVVMSGLVLLAATSIY